MQDYPYFCKMVTKKRISWILYLYCIFIIFSKLTQINTHLQCSILSASVQLEVMDADSCDDVSLPPGVAGAVGEHHLIVPLTCPQQAQVLTSNIEHTCQSLSL